MLTSVHVADIGAAGAVWRPPKPDKVVGLVHADGGFVARLQPSLKPSLEAGRVVMLGVWKTESSLNAFLATTPFGDGWHARCEQVRAAGEWPGVAEGLGEARTPEAEEPLIVVGRSKVNLTKSVDFYKYWAEAAGTFELADGLRWGCSFVGTPYFGSITMWRSSSQMLKAAYETRSGFGNATAPLEAEFGDDGGESFGAFGEGGHRGAMTAMGHRRLLAEWSYLRLRPLRLSGSVSGRDPLTTRVFD